MASFGHVAIGLAAGRFRTNVSDTILTLVKSCIFYTGLSLLPDADVVGFAFGIAYADAFGHRGASHSFAFALLVALLAWLAHRLRKRSGSRSFALLVFAVVASHPLLDTLTTGGLGSALAWPLSGARHFAPSRPIPVAPIGLGMLSLRGLRVVLTEVVLFAPFWLFAVWPRTRSR